MKDMGFSLTFSAADERVGLIWRFLTGLLLFLGFFGCLWSVLGLFATGASLPLLILVGGLYCLASCGLPGRWKLLYIAAALAPAVFAIAAGRLIGEGANVVLNQALLTCEGYVGRILPRYMVSGAANQPLCAWLFLLLPVAGLAFLCGRAALAGGAWNFVLFLLAALLGAASLLFFAPLPLICLAALMMAAAIPRILWKSKIPGNGKAPPWLFGLAAAMMLVAALFAAVPESGPAHAQDARLDAARAIHNLRYENCGHTLPEGDFTKLANFSSPNAETFFSAALEPDSWYLRGFVGEIYLGGGWAGLDAARRAEYATLFSWLHDRGFYAQNQYTLLTKALGMESAGSVISIRGADACSAYLYSPYEAADSRTDESAIGDKNLTANGLRGETEYSVAISGGFALQYEQRYLELAAAYRGGAAAATAYLTAENAYRDFVYENYLEMPKEARASIGRFLEGLELPEGRIDFSDAKLVTETYLNTLAYRAAPELIYSGGEFLTWFLEEGQEGGSFHFATAATLIFRYLGVPARYVEGYRLNKTAMQAALSGETVELSAKNAWAWAEIYRDGIGFVPFALSPPNIPSTVPQSQNYEDLAVPENSQPEQSSNLLNVALWLAVLLFILPLTIFTLLAARKALKRRRLQRLLGVSDNAEAVSRATAYLIYALSHAGILYNNGSLRGLSTEIERKFGKSSGEEYKAVIGVQQAALFSGRAIPDYDRSRVMAFLGATIAQLFEQATPYERFRLRWLICLVSIC